MKTKKEIEQLANEVHYEFQNQGLNADGCFNQYQGFIKGYTQCQEDMLNLMDDYQTWIFKTSGPLKSFKQWVDESLNKQD